MPNEREVHFRSASRFPVTLQLPDLTDPEAHEGTIDVPATDDVETPVVPTRTIRVRVENPPSPKLSFAVDYPGRLREPGGRDDGADTIVVPRSGPFMLDVHDETDPIWNPREFGFDDASVVPDPLVLTWLPDARVLAYVIDANGRPVAVTVRWVRYESVSYRGSSASDESAAKRHTFADGRIDLRRRAGWSWLEVTPDGGGLRARTFRVVVPAPADRELNLGELRLTSMPQLRVVDASGAPLPEAIVEYSRPGWQQAGEPQAFGVDAEGAWLGPDLQAGDIVFARGDEDDVPFRTLLRGDGPWTITVPCGQLDFEVTDASGTPLAGEVTFADRAARVEVGTASLRGLPCGPLRCFVGVVGHRSAIVDAVVRAEAQTIRVVLPAR